MEAAVEINAYLIFINEKPILLLCNFFKLYIFTKRCRGRVIDLN